jgi:hypothetical protein
MWFVCLASRAVALLCVAAIGAVAPVRAAEERGISFADDYSRKKFEAYAAHLEASPEQYPEELANLELLGRSEISYRIHVRSIETRGVEAFLSTDGQGVLITLSNEGGCGGEVASLNSRFAHELEHARQFEMGELALARNPLSRVWSADALSYDIGDEARAWAAQLRLSVSRDFWINRDGNPRPSLLMLFSLATSDEERMEVLVRGPYGRVKRRPGCGLVFVASSGLKAGQVVRLKGARELFGRVLKIV